MPLRAKMIFREIPIYTCRCFFYRTRHLIYLPDIEIQRVTDKQNGSNSITDRGNWQLQRKKAG